MTTNTPAPKWFESPMWALDTETTGIDPFNDRIVQAATVYHEPGKRPSAITWLINPDMDVPTEASDVHGWTNDRLAQELNGAEAIRFKDGHGRRLSREGALAEIAGKVAVAMHCGYAMVIANAPYDTTLLDADLARNGIDPISVRPTGWSGVIDPMVLDKQADKYRKQCYKADGCDPAEGVHACGGCKGSKFHQCGGCGSTDRKLSSLCRHYGVPLVDAHDAAADALGALRLARKLGALYGEVRQLRLPTVHKRQVAWRAEQCQDLRAYFDRVGKEHDGLCPAWPVHTGSCALWHKPVTGGVAA